jgi:hypothetical protein
MMGTARPAFPPVAGWGGHWRRLRSGG